ncbi:hypothetical protein H920_10829 [Fukomys damarensis]|uniref:Uncharacterized protein n=1 Tax=Fukomys damarensis TaxID=885580 RepID=A0A091D6T3_FUKDA|nr:hypothetical protein H920_10829 [Fukomys damarensis]
MVTDIADVTDITWTPSNFCLSSPSSYRLLPHGNNAAATAVGIASKFQAIIKKDDADQPLPDEITTIQSIFTTPLVTFSKEPPQGSQGMGKSSNCFGLGRVSGVACRYPGTQSRRCFSFRWTLDRCYGHVGFLSTTLLTGVPAQPAPPAPPCTPPRLLSPSPSAHPPSDTSFSTGSL